MIRSVDILDDQGNIITRRWYDSNGNAYRVVDMTNHGNSKHIQNIRTNIHGTGLTIFRKEVNNTRKENR